MGGRAWQRSTVNSHSVHSICSRNWSTLAAVISVIIISTSTCAMASSAWCWQRLVMSFNVLLTFAVNHAEVTDDNISWDAQMSAHWPLTQLTLAAQVGWMGPVQ